MELVSIVTLILVILTYTSQVLLVLVVILALFSPAHLAWLRKRALWCAFIVATVAVSGSLFYSQVAGYPPCYLCWYQRIFMFPQPILLGIALWTKDRHIYRYVIPLVVIGGLFSVTHVTIENLPTEINCSPNGISCTAKYVSEYGYVTIAVMALTAFILIFTCMLLHRQLLHKHEI